MRRRTYLAFASYLVLLFLIYLGMSYSKKPWLAQEARRMSLNLVEFMDGTFFAFLTLLPTLTLLLPVFVSLAAGDLVAAESQEGTLRSMLARPVTRSRVLAAKMAVLALYVAALCLFFATASLAVGSLCFGPPGDLLFPEMVYRLGDGLRIVPRDEAIRAILGAYLYAAGAGMTLGVLGLLLSVVCRHAASAAIATLVVYFMSHILGAIPPLQDIRPFLFTTSMEAWQYLFADPVPWGRIVRSAAVAFAFTASFAILAWMLFERKDILD